MSLFEQRCQETLQAIREAGLYRQLRRVEAVDGVKIRVGSRIEKIDRVWNAVFNRELHP